jgi:N-dimethylarginine dimethylaminohydrolase
MTTRPTFLMTDPAHYDVAYQINPWMKPGVWGADPAAHRAAAVAAWRTLRETLEDHGAAVHVTPGAAGLPDMVFPANAGVVLGRRALVARFRCPERAGEERHFLAAFEALRAGGVIDEVEMIEAGCFHEGAGDGIWDAARQLFWAGSGPRSSPRAARIMAAHFDQTVVHLPLATDQYYHLDTCFCPLSGGEVLYYPRALTPEALARVEAHVAPEQRIIADDADAEGFCVNAVSLGRTVIMASPPPRLRERLTERGYHVVGLDLGPFLLSGGAAFCMTLRLDLAAAVAPAARSLVHALTA